jgi:hypothetical protein
MGRPGRNGAQETGLHRNRRSSKGWVGVLSGCELPRGVDTGHWTLTGLRGLTWLWFIIILYKIKFWNYFILLVIESVD